jgi:hypothetical protein
MNRTFALVIIFVVATFAFVNAGDSPCDLLKSDLAAQRVDLIKQNVSFTEAQAEMFWPLYEEYAAAVTANFERQAMFTSQMAEDYDSLDAKTASGITGELMDINENIGTLQRRFHKTIRSELPSPMVAQLMTLELQINWIASLQVASQLPQLSKDGSSRSSGRGR